MKTKRTIIFCLLIFTYTVALNAKQQNAPHIGYAYPAGGRQGETFEITVGGQNLNDEAKAQISGSGITPLKTTGAPPPPSATQSLDAASGEAGRDARSTANRSGIPPAPVTSGLDPAKGRLRVAKVIAVAVFLLVTLAATVITFLLPEAYKSTARIRVERPAAESASTSAPVPFDPLSPAVNHVLRTAPLALERLASVANGPQVGLLTPRDARLTTIKTSVRADV